MLQSVNCLYQVSAKVQLSQGDQSIQVLYSCDQIVCEVENSELGQVIDVLNLGDFVGMKVQHI